MSLSHPNVVPIEQARSYAAPRPDAASRELEALVAAAARGDQRAWSLIVDRFSAAVRAVARRHRLSAHDTDDVVQATWLRLLEHIGEIRRAEALPAWLQTTAARESLKVLRSAGREQPTEAELFERQATVSDPVRGLADAERDAALGDAIATLPDRHERLMRMLLTEPEPTYNEVSRALDMPIGSIGPIRARSLERLRRNETLQAIAS
jgi:RNA polymerase sigma factor (sigma-70 family)